MTTYKDIRREESDKPLVSVIINCYNGEKYLREAIDSVLSQTYTNFEVIFWDNQSTDRSAEIFRSYDDSRLNYFYAPTHTLLYEARNHAFEKTHGDFIAFLDVDDWWELDKLEKQTQLFDDPEVGVVYGNFWQVDVRKKLSVQVAHLVHLPDGRVLNQILKDYVIGWLTVIIRRTSILDLDKAFDSRYQLIGDFDIIIRLATKWKLSCIQNPVAFYRWHGDNLSILDAERGFDEFENWCAEMVNHPIIGLTNTFKKKLEDVAYLKIMNHLMKGEKNKANCIFFKYPLGLKKLRLLVAIIIPLPLLKVLRT